LTKVGGPEENWTPEPSFSDFVPQPVAGPLSLYYEGARLQEEVLFAKD